MATTPCILVAGGGTAGHIEPALAVADAIRDGYDARILALGTTRGLEGDLVPKRGYELALIDPVPVPRKVNANLVKLPFRVLKAVWQTRAILQENHVAAVIGFGGYVAAPAYLASFLTRTPFFVHEANARTGLANKLGVFFGGTGMNSVPNSGLPGDVVGVPVKAELARCLDPDARAMKREKAHQLWGLDPAKKTLLVTGGSQGAASLNKAVAGAAEKITAAGIQILHAVGKKNPLPDHPLKGWYPVPYIEQMDVAYAVADLVVCRAGAMTVAEVTAAGLPAIYVPLPHGNGEQALNAHPVVDAGAAIIINDSDLHPEDLCTTVIHLLGRDATELAAMAAAARGSDAGQAAQTIACRVMARIGYGKDAKK